MNNIDLTGYKREPNLKKEDIFGTKKVKRIVYTFFDEEDNIVAKDSEKAVKVIIKEEDELGRMLNETTGYLNESNEEIRKSR